MDPVYPNVSALACAEILRDGLAGATFWLFQNAIALSLTTTVDDLVNADFDGYSPVVVSSFGNPYLLVDGGAAISSPSHQWSYVPPGSGTPVTNNIFGWALTIPGGGSSSGSGTITGTLIAAATYEEAIPMSRVGNSIIDAATVKVFAGNPLV